MMNTYREEAEWYESNFQQLVNSLGTPKVYYGVYGFNGAGVYTNWASVVQSKKYIKGFMVKKFSTWQEAVAFIANSLEVLTGSGTINQNSFIRMNFFYQFKLIHLKPQKQKMKDMIVFRVEK
ncbi:viroplasmin family protein [Megasphaera sueciensis]|uniref:ribonuclease H1 domain-containing protein n=1 Tax=Megasphaera sueciensis TaxID=349094 RepID=UPI003D05E636